MYSPDNITLEMLNTYLKKAGWNKLKIEVDLPISIWQHFDLDEITLRVPNNNKLADYTCAMQRVVKDLALAEHRAIEDILASLHDQDIISIRIIGDDVENGTIPINDGALLFQSAESLIKSAASKIFIGAKKGLSKKEKISEFMDSVLLGQTQIGSYAVNIITPKAIPYDKQQDFASVPTGEMVNDKIYNALKSLKKSIDVFKQDDNILEFAHASADGVDAGICHALIQMSGANKERDVEIKLESNSLIKSDASRSVYFHAQDFGSVEKAYNYLSGRDFTIKGGHYVGQIVALKKEPDSNSGKVTINTFVQEKSKKVSFKLSGENYELAIDAHKKNQTTYVQCVGDLHCTRTSAEINNLISFNIIEKPSFD